MSPAEVIPVLIGPFPEPIHGVSLTNEKLAALIAARGLTCERIDLSPGPAQGALRYHLTRVVRTARGVWRVLMAPSSRPRSYELSVDGGFGLIYSIAMTAATRLRRAPLMLYHHTTRYILSNSVLMRALLLAAGPNVTHIMCSARMFEQFRKRYDAAGHLIVVSNAAWIEPSVQPQLPPDPDRILLGFLSVLSEEKGPIRAIDTLRALRRNGVAARLMVAGVNPTAPVAAALAAAQREFGDDLVYLGRISDAEKWQFLATIDYFLFPTLFYFETQSSVAPEAMAAGAPVIAYDHRFVGELIGEEGGKLIDTSHNFAEEACAWIATGQDIAIRAERRRMARLHYGKIRAEAAGHLDLMLDQLLSPRSG